jgi:hypothetical protein
VHVNGLKQAKRDPKPQVSNVNVPAQGVSISIEKVIGEDDTYGAKIKGPRAVPEHAALKLGAKKRRGKRTDSKADGFSRMGVSGSHE